jgi:hypothetical protein
MQYTKEIKELLEAREQEYRKQHPLTSDERSKEILEAASQVTLDDYNPDSLWTFGDGECPFGWYDAQVKAINYFGHIFCINPFYDNFNKYTPEKELRPPNSPDIFWGSEFKSTNDMLDNLTKYGQRYLDMTIRTIKYLKAQCGIEFPNGWGNQFQIKA